MTYAILLLLATLLCTYLSILFSKVVKICQDLRILGTSCSFMRRSRKFCQRESNSKRAIMGPQAKHHLNGTSLAGRRCPNIDCWLGSLVIFQGIRTSIAKTSYSFVIFQGWGDPDPLSPIWIRACFIRAIH